MTNKGPNRVYKFPTSRMVGALGLVLAGSGMHAVALGKGIVPLLDDIRFAYGAIVFGAALGLVGLWGFVQEIRQQ